MNRAILFISCFIALELFNEAYCQSPFDLSNPPPLDIQPRGRSGRPEQQINHLLRSTPNLQAGSLPNTQEFALDARVESDQECGEEIILCRGFFDHRYPTSEGYCNNRVNPRRGATERSFKRLLSASYADGADTLRRAVNGRILSSARRISNALQGGLVTNTRYTQMLPFWGQFLVHDIALTLEPEGSTVACNCSNDDNPECINIPIPRSDPQYKSDPLRRKTCFATERSQPVADSEDCGSFVRQQLNEISAYLDMGIIYGNSEEHLEAIRTTPGSKKGELVTETGEAGFGDLLPSSNYSDDILPAARKIFCPEFVKLPQRTLCRVSGEARTNENSVLHSHHTVWMRTHNAVVKELKRHNPDWSSERLLQIGKRIVTALHQRVTYEHFLPAIIGPDAMRRFDLNLIDEGYYYGYDSTYSAGVSNSFATAAFRMGHALINEWFSRPNNRWSEPQADAIRVKTSLFNVGQVTSVHNSGGPNSFIRGLANDSALQFDPTFADDLRNFLDRPNFVENGFGFDLLARNIQRGRDHGLPPYVKFRKFCGLSVPRRFRDLRDVMTQQKIRKLKRVYSSVRDIDLYAGGVSELSVEGGTVGPTFACIIGNQFRDLKKGDRFWHENAPPVGSFSRAQLKAIRAIPFPALLCVMVSDMRSIQERPMEKVSETNRRRNCGTYGGINLVAFKDPAGDLYSESISQDTEKTAWFPTQFYEGEREFTVSELYQWLSVKRPSEVCRQVINTNIRFVNGNIQVQFSCLPGTISHSDFPPVLSDKYYWTSWYRELIPGEVDSVIIIPPINCGEPLAIQAQTLDGVPASETGDVFSQFSPTAGLFCSGSNQASGACNQYKVRYLCLREDD